MRHMRHGACNLHNNSTQMMTMMIAVGADHSRHTTNTNSFEDELSDLPHDLVAVEVHVASDEAGHR